MSTPSLLPRFILDDEIDLTPEPPEFESLVARELGNAGAEDDGFNAQWNEAARELGTLVEERGTLDRDLNNARAVLPEFAQNEADPIIGSLQQPLQDGDTVLHAYEQDLSLVEPPPEDGGETVCPEEVGKPDRDPQPYPPEWACNPLGNLNVECVGKPAVTWCWPMPFQVGFDPGFIQSVRIVEGDRSIWTAFHAVGCPAGQGNVPSLNLTINPVKEGRFQVLVEVTGGPPLRTVRNCAQVKIVKPVQQGSAATAIPKFTL